MSDTLCRRCNLSSFEVTITTYQSAPGSKIRLAIEELTQRVKEIEEISQHYIRTQNSIKEFLPPFTKVEDRCSTCNFSTFEASCKSFDSVPTIKARSAIENIIHSIKVIEFILFSFGFDPSLEQGILSNAFRPLKLIQFSKAIEELNLRAKKIETFLGI